MRRFTESMYHPYRDAKSPPPSPLIASPGELPGVLPAPVGKFGGPPCPGTAFSGSGSLRSKTFDLCVGGFALSFSNCGTFSAFVGGSGGFCFFFSFFSHFFRLQTCFFFSLASLGCGLSPFPL